MKMGICACAAVPKRSWVPCWWRSCESGPLAYMTKKLEGTKARMKTLGCGDFPQNKRFKISNIFSTEHQRWRRACSSSFMRTENGKIVREKDRQ
jgi:hypothetical protein